MIVVRDRLQTTCAQISFRPVPKLVLDSDDLNKQRTSQDVRILNSCRVVSWPHCSLKWVRGRPLHSQPLCRGSGAQLSLWRSQILLPRKEKVWRVSWVVWCRWHISFVLNGQTCYPEMRRSACLRNSTVFFYLCPRLQTSAQKLALVRYLGQWYRHLENCTCWRHILDKSAR